MRQRFRSIGASQFSGGSSLAPAVEDALDFLVDLMRDEPRSAAAYGYDLWIPKITEEGETEYSFVFIRRQAVRRLLMLTPRDPYSATKHSFSPFRST